MIKATLLKPLDGSPEGSEREFEKTDFDTLKAMGAVRAAASDLRDDGPTVAEYVAAGYKAANYPPQGFASRSTPEEIAAAVAANPAGTPAQPNAEAKKAAASPANKKAPPVANKSAAGA